MLGKLQALTLQRTYNHSEIYKHMFTLFGFPLVTYKFSKYGRHT
jgi:hypothetical protein